MNSPEYLPPYERVKRRYTLPFELYPYQVATVDELHALDRQGHYLAVGVGKTATSTVCTLFKFLNNEAQIAIVLCPPILIPGWIRWLNSIKGASAKAYRGTPKARAKLEFDTDFLVMSYAIFKLDHDTILSKLGGRSTTLICDEATAIKSIESQTHKAVRDFANTPGNSLLLLTGTPISKPYDGYAYVKLLAPTIYKNFNQFKNIHTARVDFFKNPVEYQNLDLLADNMKQNAVRILKEDVLDQLPSITYTPMFYELSPDHYRLYNRIADEQILSLEEGGKIDVTQVTALYHALQQAVVAWDYFGDNPNLRASCFDLIDEVIEEMAGNKLIIFTYYQRTSATVTKYLQNQNAVAVYGAISSAQQEKNIDRFMNDESCKVLVAQAQSAGYGLNLQEHCSDVLFIESPTVPIHFEQAVGRVYRNGQRNKVHVRVAIAERTIQVRLHRRLMDNDALVNQIVRNYQDIRAALYGE